MTLRNLFVCLILVFSQPLLAQESEIDTTIKLDLLKSPSSPAFNLLGISPSLIERPGDITEFRLSLQNANANFTTIPNSYAVEVAPFLMKRKKYLLNTYNNNQYNIPQTLVISAGYSRLGPDGADVVDSLKSTKVAFGLKFSIRRPNWTQKTEKIYDTLVSLQKGLLDKFKQLTAVHALEKERDSLKKALLGITRKPAASWTESEKKRVGELRNSIARVDSVINSDVNIALQEETNEEISLYQKVKETAASFPSERKGFFMDFASGIVFDFPGNRFNSSKTAKAGAWLTFGNENGHKGVTSLFILRYLYQPEAIFADPQGVLSTDKVSTFDAGGRLLINAMDSRFSLSSELLYRSVLGSSDLKPSWRFVLNAEYAIWKNQKLTFAFGRNFDGTISKGGNLIAALNFIAGLGSNRAVGNTPN